jgi:hypothetical protein
LLLLVVACPASWLGPPSAAFAAELSTNKGGGLGKSLRPRGALLGVGVVGVGGSRGFKLVLSRRGRADVVPQESRWDVGARAQLLSESIMPVMMGFKFQPSSNAATQASCAACTAAARSSTLARSTSSTASKSWTLLRDRRAIRSAWCSAAMAWRSGALAAWYAFHAASAVAWLVRPFSIRAPGPHRDMT